MCGIAGLIGDFEDPAGAGRRMLAALRHRGPDDEDLVHPTRTVTFVHTRLAILDPSPAGHQPMRDVPPTGHASNWVTFNGEVFNFLELNKELAAEGWRAATRCDTETLLHAHRAWGDSAVDRMRGMFAYALYDASDSRVLLIRDRLGIKPLYLFRPRSGGLVFASEVRTLLALGPEFITPIARRSALESFLAQGAVQGYESIVEGIELLPPGTQLSVEATTGKEHRRRTYWTLSSQTGPPLERLEEIHELATVAREAVRMRLISDVPIGLFLSAGVDSTALLTLASEVSGSPVRTLSIGFDEAAFDESREAATTAATFGSEHITHRLTGPDLLAAMPRGLAAMDQPTVDGLNTFIVSRAARDAGLTVAVSGLGGDELFGGYASFADVPRAARMRRHGILTRAASLGALLRRDRTGAKVLEMAKRPPDLLDLYLLRRELFLPAERRALHAAVADSDQASGLPVPLLEDLRRRSAALDEINQVSFFELELYMRHMLLRDADVFSMAAAIEYRVPFLDHRLVEAVFRLPGTWKRPDPRPKPLLLDLTGPRLPESSWRRAKRGFAFPWPVWFSPGGALFDLAQDAVSDNATWTALGLHATAVANIWKAFRHGDKRISALQILAFVTLRHYAAQHRVRVS